MIKYNQGKRNKVSRSVPIEYIKNKERKRYDYVYNCNRGNIARVAGIQADGKNVLTEHKIIAVRFNNSGNNCTVDIMPVSILKAQYNQSRERLNCARLKSFLLTKTLKHYNIKGETVMSAYSICGIDCDLCKFKKEMNGKGCREIKGKVFIV